MKECFFTVLEFYQRSMKRFTDIVLPLFKLNVSCYEKMDSIFLSRKQVIWKNVSFFGWILFGFCFKATVKMYLLSLLCLFFFKEKLTQKMFILSSLLSSRQSFKCKRAHALDIINMRHRALFDFWYCDFIKATAGLTSDKATQEFPGEK